jgi:hypothetical protein
MLLRAAPDSRLADYPAEHAALELYFIPARHGDVARIGPAVFAIIKLALPAVCAGLLAPDIIVTPAMERSLSDGFGLFVSFSNSFAGRTTLMQIPPPQE